MVSCTQTNQAFNSSLLFLTYWSASVSTNLITFSFQSNQKDNLTVNINQEWDTIWKVFPELSDSFRKPEKMPLSSSSTIRTNTSTIHNSTSSTTTSIQTTPPIAPAIRVKPPLQPPLQPYVLLFKQSWASFTSSFVTNS